MANDIIDLWRYETAARLAGHTVIAGVDEVGRGPLAGPVVAACVILPTTFSTDGINDSKKLTERRREKAFERIQTEALAVGVGIVHREVIDQINILRATHQAMGEALQCLPSEWTPHLVLVDGLPVRGLPCAAQQAIVGGDARSVSIAAASIIAKVTRDRMMAAYDIDYPEYGFARHKGYGAAVHMAALRAHGPCPIHRRSFAPVAAVCAPDQIDAHNLKKIGAAGERETVAFLEARDYRMVDANVRPFGGARRGEIDLIGWHGECLVFIEVKTRRAYHGDLPSPAEAINAPKRRQLVALARAYLGRHRLDDVPCRFDVVEVIRRRDGGSDITVIPNAFTADDV